MFRTAILLSILTAILLATGFLSAGIFGMAIALILAIIINFFSYWFSDKIVLRMYKAKPTDDKELIGMIKDIAREAKIPMPKVYIVPSDVPNAFATGRSKSHAAVAVTQGLSILSHDEMRGVIAHEISHIKHNDILIQTMAATIAGAVAFLAQFGYWTIFMGGRRDAGSLIGLVLMIIFAPVAAIIIQLAISRRREYKADFSSALLTKHPTALASALQKISEIGKQRPISGSRATSHLWIVNPFKQDSFTSLFATHPPISRRIAKLERMAHKKSVEND